MADRSAPELVVRTATTDDLELLGRLNEQLILDEGASTPQRGAALVARMGRFLAEGYRAELVVVAGDAGAAGDVVAYALWRPDGPGVHVRQFFVARGHRRAGLGRRAFALLTDARWAGRPLTLDVLAANERGVAFWRALGFEDHLITMRRPPS